MSNDGYTGEIRLGPKSRKQYDKNGNLIHYVETGTWNEILKQLKLSEETTEKIIKGEN